MSYSRGLRGNAFEELINYTNTIYMKNGLALVQKIPTPIKPVELDNSSRTISLAYFERKSSVDYIGVAQGVPICFDVKETTKKSLPLQNIHLHQLEFMKMFEKQDGIAFILVHFVFANKYFYMSFGELNEHVTNAQKKSIPYAAFTHEINFSRNILHYLEQIKNLMK